MALLFSCISGADVRETAWKVGSGALKESEACATAAFLRCEIVPEENEQDSSLLVWCIRKHPHSSPVSANCAGMTRDLT